MRTLAVLLLLFLTACSTSLDKHAYTSTPSLPTTLTITDPYTGNVIWKKDVPVFHKIVIDFDRQREIEAFKVHPEAASRLNYFLYVAGNSPRRGELVEKKSIDLPGTAILLRVSYRPAPEYPPGYTPPGRPADEEELAAGTVPVIDAAEPDAPATEAPRVEPVPEVNPQVSPAPAATTEPQPAGTPEGTTRPSEEIELPDLPAE